jgi:hypothetical protein
MSSNQGLDVKVVWSEEQQQFIATCNQYPSMTWLNDNAITAMMGLLGIIAVVESAKRPEDTKNPCFVIEGKSSGPTGQTYTRNL